MYTPKLNKVGYASSNKPIIESDGLLMNKGVRANKITPTIGAKTFTVNLTPF